MGHHMKKMYVYGKSDNTIWENQLHQEKRGEKGKTLFKEIMTIYFSNLKMWKFRYIKLKVPKEIQTKEIFTKIHFNKMVKNQRQKERKINPT